ncbi:MAG: toll/interleukin-1 receptor domain-containing protein [Phormidesmis sp.]
MSLQEQSYDVFLSHNTKDKNQVLIVARYLESQGLKLWIDKNDIRGGNSLPKEIANAIYHSRVAAVFVGRHGLGTWQQDELETITNRQIRGRIDLIPILLPGICDLPDDPDYCNLEKLLYISFSSDDFSSSEDKAELTKLSESVRHYINEWTTKKLEKLIKERELAVLKLQEISQEIDKMEAQLKTTLSKERQRVVEWLASRGAEKIMNSYARRALKDFCTLEKLLRERDDGLQRFCSDIYTCLKFTSLALQTEQPSKIEKMAINLFLAQPEFETSEFCQERITTKLYQKVFSLIEADLPEDLDETIKKELRKCFIHIKKQISVLI